MLIESYWRACCQVWQSEVSLQDLHGWRREATLTSTHSLTRAHTDTHSLTRAQTHTALDRHTQMHSKHKRRESVTNQRSGERGLGFSGWHRLEASTGTQSSKAQDYCGRTSSEITALSTALQKQGGSDTLTGGQQRMKEMHKEPQQKL